MSAPTVDRDAPARGRSRLFASWAPDAPYDRSELVALVRGGIRGLHLDAPVHVSVDEPERGAAVLRLLRDAAGTGLRVYWIGSVDGLETRVLEHLDPPRDEAGTPAWPVPRTPTLTLRRGPGFVWIDDLRGGRSARLLVDDPDHVSVLARYEGPSGSPPPSEPGLRRALDELTRHGLVAPIGPLHLSRPVRFRYGRG